MNNLFRLALLKADEVRMELELDMFEPISIFDACAQMGVSVRFVDINMEGLFVKQEDDSNPTILLSNQRPIPRRCFTCAHELGHKVFTHGLRLDAFSDREVPFASKDPDEILVDAFAGALLMPIAGVEAEFAKRSWKIQNASPLEFYTICSVFGTGYQTLIYHCKAYKLISETKLTALLKYTPAKLLEDVFETSFEKSYFKLIDFHSQLKTIDLEEGNYIILPKNARIEGDHLNEYRKTSLGTGYIAVKPVIVRVSSSDRSVDSFVRIQRQRYIGLAEYRHLETLKD
jgi:Zn-dependent peptidase ImmA (M78 family)